MKPARAEALSLLAAAVVSMQAYRCDPKPSAEGTATRAAEPSSRAPPVPPARRAPAADGTARGPQPQDGGAGRPAPSRFVVDELGDCGPAAAAAASPRGVVFVTKNDEVLLARLDGLPRRAARPVASPVSPIRRPRTDFVALARPPAVGGDFVYWVSGGRLVRRKIPRDGTSGPLEVLAKDARTGTQVTTAPPAKDGMPRAVGYVARAETPGEPLRARLWIEGNGIRDLTEEGAASNSIALATTPKGYLALSLEGRSGMSPVHARAVQVAGVDRPALGDDVVAWLAGPSHPLTQLAAVAAGDGGAWGLVALERDISHFGLARFHVPAVPAMNAAVDWRDYPNGLEPAPVASAWLCGSPAVAYAVPASKTPGAPQELHLATIDRDRMGEPTVLARARAFSAVSLSTLSGGALLAYVADWRTWTRTIRCRGRAVPRRGRLEF